MAKKEIEQKKELARLYFMNGDTQKNIAEKVDVSTVTICKWVKENGWDTIRAAKTVSRRELIIKFLKRLDTKLDSGEITMDEMIKGAAAIEKLDKQTNVVTVIEVFSIYNQWLMSRQQLDPELTPELVRVMNKYQDIYIAEQSSSANIILKEL